jgi:hypothetical protein
MADLQLVSHDGTGGGQDDAHRRELPLYEYQVFGGFLKGLVVALHGQYLQCREAFALASQAKGWTCGVGDAAGVGSAATMITGETWLGS